MEHKWTVLLEDGGVSLGNFIKKQLPAYSNREIKRWLESNCCFVNGNLERFASALVKKGDKIVFKISSKEAKQPVNIEVLFEDEDFFIINKPFGLSSESPLLKRLAENNKISLQLVHRLDKDTTGALIFAKNKIAYEKILEAFRKREIKKTYLALVNGYPGPAGLIQNYLGKIREYGGQAIWGSVDKAKGLYAETEWKCIQKGAGVSLVECHPLTGRTHQIRVHMASLGCPLLGDIQYGYPQKEEENPTRVLLHAYSYFFIHPLTKQVVEIKAPIPADFIHMAKKKNIEAFS